MPTISDLSSRLPARPDAAVCARLRRVGAGSPPPARVSAPASRPPRRARGRHSPQSAWLGAGLHPRAAIAGSFRLDALDHGNFWKHHHPISFSDGGQAIGCRCALTRVEQGARRGGRHGARIFGHWERHFHAPPRCRFSCPIREIARTSARYPPVAGAGSAHAYLYRPRAKSASGQTAVSARGQFCVEP